MNSRELVYRALRGEATPRAACGPLAVHFCARDAGVPLSKFSLDAQTLADCVVKYWEKYRPDAVWISADTWVTAEAAGAPVTTPVGDELVAGLQEGIVQTIEDLDKLRAPDPSKNGRQPMIIDALGRVRKALGDEVFIVGCFDQSPFSLACALGGINDIMVKIIDDEDFMEALLDRCVEYCVAYGTALAGAGADMLSTGDSPAGLIGPALYREWGLPGEQRVFKRLHEDTSALLSLHICGNSTQILGDMAKSGADVLELDHLVPMDLACRVVPQNVAIWGNLDPVSVLMNGTPGQVREASIAALKTCAQAGRSRFVLSSGCTLAPDTPEANVRALIDVAREYRY
ncbi:uroporphyrinogen decarboxylase family protein [bacterium]|nr:uroporphyrinogen decarboxylase family protein [bacterium]